MTFSRGLARVLTILLVVGVAGQGQGVSLAAVSYPQRPVTMIVNFPAGGVVDITARALVEATKPHFPQPIVIANRPGGTGTVGATEVLQARPDGHTVGMSPVAPMIVIPQTSNVPYKTPDDFRPVMRVVNMGFMFVVRADAPWKTMTEVLAFARSNPGQLRVGVPGLGSIPHLNVEMLRRAAGVDWTYVPFGGGDPQVLAAILGAHIEGATFIPLTVRGQVRAGNLKVLATFEEKRNALLPGVPTFRELRFDVALGAYQLVYAPRETPQGVVQVLHDALRKGLETDAFKQFAREQGLPIAYQSPKDLAAQLRRDFAAYGDILRKLNLLSK